jgi:hypothetical protein
MGRAAKNVNFAVRREWHGRQTKQVKRKKMQPPAGTAGRWATTMLGMPPVGLPPHPRFSPPAVGRSGGREWEAATASMHHACRHLPSKGEGGTVLAVRSPESGLPAPTRWWGVRAKMRRHRPPRAAAATYKRGRKMSQRERGGEQPSDIEMTTSPVTPIFNLCPARASS